MQKLLKAEKILVCNQCFKEIKVGDMYRQIKGKRRNYIYCGRCESLY